MGRWIDFRNDYKTMDLPFMESVWWVFSELHKKGLVYRGFKVMPYSTACTTPLSNFEANLNYKGESARGMRMWYLRDHVCCIGMCGASMLMSVDVVLMSFCLIMWHVFRGCRSRCRRLIPSS